MAAYSLFVEDEVCVHKPGKGFSFGIICENAEFASSSEDEGDEKPEERLQTGTVKVAWHPTGKETVVAENKVQLVDRSLMPGDVVRRLIPGQKSQSGYVTDMDVRCHLRVLRTNKYIYNVDSKDLEPLEPFECGQEIMLDSWLGRVENVTMDAVLVFSDGAKCQVDQNDLYSYFEEKTERHGKFSECLWYPGQELKGPLASLSYAKWLHSTTRHSHKTSTKKGKTPTVHVTIEKIIPKQVEVHWVFRGYERVENPDMAINPPPRTVEGADIERLKVLEWFSHCKVQVGDRMVYRVKNDDILSSVPPAKAYDARAALDKSCPVKVAPEDGDNQNSVSTTSASQSNNSVENNMVEDEDADYVDVDDEDDDESDCEGKLGACGGRNTGSRGSGGGRKKHTLYKGGGGNSQRHKHGQHPKPAGRRACPKDRVVKADDVVEVEVELTTSWAVVMWQDGTVEKDIPSVELFPVHHLDELEFFPGDYVTPSVDLAQQVDYGVLVKADHRERTCLIHWFRAYDVGKASEPTLVERDAELSVYDIKDHPDYKFRPGQSVVRVGGFENLPADSGVAPQSVGQIVALYPKGHLEIKWADGSASHCFPQEVFIVSDETDNSDFDSSDSETDYDSEGSGDSWETESESEVIGEDGAKGNTGAGDNKQQGGEALCEHKQELDTLLTRAQTALSRLQKLLNSYDVTVSSPDCFVDILRIYRSCHDLDKILQSSFFNDPDLQDLVAQARLELNRDRVNRTCRNLTQVFEQWSKSVCAGSLPREGSSFGTVSVGGKTIKIGTVKKGKIVEVNVEQLEKDIQAAATESLSGEANDEICSGATGGNPALEGGDQHKGVSGDADCPQARALKKESSEPAISNLSEAWQGGERRPSDPLNDYSAALAHRGTEANLVGENCVSKAAKRTKSDGFDDSGREVKKSRDESRAANQTAHELCFKICQNLQRQVEKIQEEVNKRTRRLISAAENSASEKSLETVSSISNGGTEKVAAPAAEESTAQEGKPPVQGTDKQSPDAAELGASDAQGAESAVLSEPADSVPHSMDEAGEKPTLAAPAVGVSGVNGAQACNERGDVLRQNVAMATGPDPGNEASCEESTSQASLLSEDVQADIAPCKGFEIYGEAVSFHKYVSQESQPTNARVFKNSIRKELKLFQSSLPDGIFVKGFENRLDLYSVMILGPQGTPYEDALFLFDMMMPNDYPSSPPALHYYSFCSDRLNPNLYEDGKVCVSLLGTWSGKGSEVWTSKSNLLQVLLSIQGLILVPEPYYNEAYYERQRGTQVGVENSRMYNEMATLKTVQSLTRMCHTLPELFKHEIYTYLKSRGPRMIARLRHWMGLNEQERVKAEAMQTCVNSDNQTCDSPTSSAQTAASVEQKPPTPSAASVEQKPPTPSAASVEQKPPTPSRSEASNTISSSSSCEGAGSEESDASNPQPISSSVDVDAGNTRLIKPQSELGPAASNQPSKLLHNHEEKSAAPSIPNGISIPLDSGKNIEEGTSVDNALSLKSKPEVTSSSLRTLAASSTTSCSQADGAIKPPEFTLFPMSRGFCLALAKGLAQYEQALQQLQDPALVASSDPA